MGLSLRNIVKKVGDVATGVERQINPFDNGATYNNPTPPPPVQPSLVSNIKGSLQGAGQNLFGAGQGFGNMIVNQTVGNVGRLSNEIQQVNPISGAYSRSSLGNRLYGDNSAVGLANHALDQIDQIDTNLNNQFRQGKITRQRFEALRNANQQDRQNVTGALVKQAQALPTPKQAVGDIGQLGVNLLSAGAGGSAAGAAIDPATQIAATKAGITGADLAAQTGTGQAITGILSGQGLSGLAQAAHQGGLMNAAYQGPSSALQAYGQGKSKAQIVKAGAVGLAQGYGTGAALGSLGYGAQKAVQAAPQLNQKLGQEGSLGVGESIGKPKVNLKPTEKELSSGAALGMSPEEVAAAKAAQLSPTLPGIGAPKIKPKGTLAKVTDEALANQSKAPAPTVLRKVATAKDAVRVGESVSSNFNQTANALAKAQDKVLGKSLANRDLFFNAVEHPEQASKIADNFSNPQAFLDLVNQHKAVTNMEYSLFTGAGKARPFNATYINHNVDLSTPEARAAYDALSTTVRGGTSKSRLYPTLEDLSSNGLSLKKQSAGDATRAWASRQGNIIRDATLENRLKTLDPNIQVVQVPGEGPRFFSGNKEINKELRGVQPYTVNNPILKATNAVNTGLKQVGLFGGGFHDFKTTIRQFTTDVASGRNPFSRLAEGNKQMASNTAHEAWNQKQLTAGYGQMWADADVAKTTMGADLHGGVSATAKDLKKGSVENLNPYMKRLFNNKLDYFKKQLVIDEAARHGITPENYDPNNPAMLKVVQDAGAGAQNWFGGLNQRVLGKTPITQQILKYVTLAPDFTEGKIRAVGSAFRGGEMGSLARRQVISEAVGVAVLAEAASKGLTGQFTNPLQALYNPQVKTNMKDKQGRALTIGLPGSTVADVGRLATDPAHFALSHLGAGASVAESALTGKDYYGNPLVDPYKNPNPSLKDNLVAALKSKGTIPGVQISKSLSGKQDWATAAINTLGGRVTLDKTDPKYQEQQAFFKAKDSALKGLNPNQLAQWNSIHPKTQDAGEYISASASPAEKDIVYQKHPDIFAVDKKIALASKTHDPIYDLTDQQRNALYNIAGFKDSHGGTTGAGALGNVDKQYVKAIQSSPWYSDFQKKRSDYYGSLNLPTNPLNPPGNTQPSDAVAKVLDQMGNPGVKTSALLAANPDAEAYLSQHADEINQQRADKQLPPLPKFPTPPNDAVRQKELTYSGLPSGTGARSKFLKANPDYQAYWQQKQDYYTALDGSSSTASNYSSSSRVPYAQYKAARTSPLSFAISSTAGGKARRNKATAKKVSIGGSKVAKVSAPKVSIKKSLV